MFGRGSNGRETNGLSCDQIAISNKANHGVNLDTSLSLAFCSRKYLSSIRFQFYTIILNFELSNFFQKCSLLAPFSSIAIVAPEEEEDIASLSQMEFQPNNSNNNASLPFPNFIINFLLLFPSQCRNFW